MCKVFDEWKTKIRYNNSPLRYVCVCMCVCVLPPGNKALKSAVENPSIKTKNKNKRKKRKIPTGNHAYKSLLEKPWWFVYWSLVIADIVDAEPIHL